MALIKKHIAPIVEELPKFSTLDDAIDFFESHECLGDNCEGIRDYVIEEIAKLGGGEYLIKFIGDEGVDKKTSTKIASVIANMDPDDAPIEEIMELLKLDDAYIRSLGISILRDFGDAIKYYIVKFLIGNDRDLRIFAINVLGDVDFVESRDMLVELLETEKDINVAMTAVDYMGEIGEEEDVSLLETLKDRFSGDPYAEFAVNSAIKMIEG